MSDTRRRRKSNDSGGSEDLSDSYDELNVTKETQSSDVAEVEEQHDSEYESGDSGSEADSQEGGLRESGDGQEEDKPARKLDDDEDRRNPQYIPKRGTFYEHDDRTTEETGTEETVETPNEREAKEKKVWKDKEDRWDHDRYNDDEQAPKSHDELVAVYGYDIRNEEGPPRARRRRRYGRGPNKYTRNWEDEDAYGKPGGPPAVGRGGPRKNNRSGEEFPALSGTDKEDPSASQEEPVISSAWYSNKNKSQPRTQNFPPLQSQNEPQNSKPVSTNNSTPANENKISNEPTNPAWKKELKNNTQNQSPNRGGGGGGDTDKSTNHKTSPRDTNNKRQVQESVSLAASRARGRGFKGTANTNNVGTNRLDYKSKGRGSGSVLLDNRRNNSENNHVDDQQLINDLKQMNVNDGGSFQQGNRQNKNFYPQSPGQVRPGTVPPRMQQQPSQQQSPRQQQHDAAGNRPKRYSSLRQRPPVPEGPGQQGYQPQHGQHGYYPQAGNSRGVLEPQGYPPGHFDQAAPVATPTAPLAGQPVLPLPPGGQPANFAPPPFLVPPPQYLPSPQTAPPNLINFVQGPSGPPFPPNFPGYQGFTPPVQPQGPPPPQELFQPQGCTYYSPAQQQQHAVPMRRPKAAIPILPPPDNQHIGSRGRGRTMQQPNLAMPVGGGMQRSHMEGKNVVTDNEGKLVQGQQQFVTVQSENQVYVDNFIPNENNEPEISYTDNGDTNDKDIRDIDDDSEASKEVKVSLDAVVPKEEPQRVPINDELVPSEPLKKIVIEAEAELSKVENSVVECPKVEETAA